ncbi:Ankyrin repeat-containing protein [Capsicum baccatum]|uniref:Ankyrin repeat-containing protein n=1 Tax=Capsicum baccatum TaxID=33114 RepID=A0A2G2VN92_CAPBA|nr:Ankyrin repeat-containing protein [Capsicum baccatum]
MTVDVVNTTALHTAANQGHIEMVNYLLEQQSSLATIAKSNGKTSLHSSARNGHLQVLKALLTQEPGIATRMDNKGQTALHMAVKGQNLEIVEELTKADPSLVNMVDNKGNTPLHIAARKGRAEIVKLLLAQNERDAEVINKSHETALDTAEKMSQGETVAILQEYGVQSARVLKPQPTNPARELKQTVSDIKHEVHDQLKHTKQTRKRIQGITKRLHKMQREGLNNAINSSTVVAILIATIAFAGIFQVPGQYYMDKDKLPEGHVIGEANISNHPGFLVFFVFDSVALFISLSVVVVQTTVVVIQQGAKKKLMSIINKLMWIACVFVSVAYLALSFVVVGRRYRLMAYIVTALGAVIMLSTIAVMLYWVIKHRIESSNKKSMRKNSLVSKSMEFSDSALSDDNNEFKIYAL